MYPDFQVIATDVSAERLSYMEKLYHIETCPTLEESLKKGVDAALICTPPSSHVPVALSLVEEGVHVFIEKPLSNSLNNIDELLENARSANLTLLVGYCFRFHPGLKTVKEILGTGELGKVLLAQAEFGQYLPSWRPWQDYAKSYTAMTEFGGGIILDGSHEIDYLRWLVGEVKEISCFAGKLSALKVETIDVAGLLLKFSNGSIGMIHIDFVRRDYSRSCEIICENGSIKWNYQENSLKIYRQDNSQWEIYNNLTSNANDMYEAEMKHFIACINKKEIPLVNGVEGLKTLKVALAALESSEKGKVVRI
jgi:predicted dehydrogenase